MGYRCARFAMTGRAARSPLAVVAVLTAAWAVVCCSVDDRQLQATGGGFGAGASAGSVGGSDSSNPTGDAGEGGQSDQPTPLPICDYGSGVAAGCETLVDNPGFSKDTFGWAPEDGTVAMTWSDTDAAGNRQSGSISVVNSLFGEAMGTASRGATQCLSTHAGESYAFAVDVFIPKSQGDGPDGGMYTGNAGLSVIFFTSDRCDEFTLKSFTSGVVEETGVWEHREGKGTTPEGAKSMLVRLVTFKDFREYSFEARFDNVLLRAE